MENERTPAALTHVLGILTLFVGPLVMYFLLRKKASPWLRDHLDEAVNYHILVLAAFVVCIVLAVVFTNFGFAGMALLVFVLAFALFAASVVFGIVAAWKAAHGKAYHFPLDVKMIK
ncbi:MAG: uncharacterized protein QOI63_1885 [Thermoplasmata archaeon]|jgi:uncharacterized Tic20 family protein|nr:uncharacterized protein [Thermoplasmata archaeon]